VTEPLNYLLWDIIQETSSCLEIILCSADALWTLSCKPSNFRRVINDSEGVVELKKMKCGKVW
jgi:hypothetical protein